MPLPFVRDKSARDRHETASHAFPSVTNLLSRSKFKRSKAEGADVAYDDPEAPSSSLENSPEPLRTVAATASPLSDRKGLLSDELNPFGLNTSSSSLLGGSGSASLGGSLTVGDDSGDGSSITVEIVAEGAEVPLVSPSTPTAPPPPPPRIRGLQYSMVDGRGEGESGKDEDDMPIGGIGHLSVRDLAQCMLDGNPDTPHMYLHSIETLTSAERAFVLDRVDACFREMAGDYRASNSDDAFSPGLSSLPEKGADATVSKGPAPAVPKRSANMRLNASLDLKLDTPPPLPSRETVSQPAGLGFTPRQPFRMTLEDHSNKNLTELPASAFENPDVEKFIATSNLLTSVVPAEVLAYSESELSDMWPHLQLLDLSYNRITQLPAQLSLLGSSLHVLNLTGNFVSDFPFEFLELEQLTTLYLASNNLENIPFVVTQLPSLRDLHLGRNRITDLGIQSTLATDGVDGDQDSLVDETPAIGHSARVKHRWHDLACLNMRENNIVDISAIGSLRSLTVLKLQDNKIEEIPVSLTQLAELRVLELARNRISRIPPEMGALESLLQLDLGENRIGFGSAGNSLTLAEQDANLVHLGQLKEIQDLSLMHNGITRLPAGFFALNTGVETLNIAHNAISELPDDILRFGYLCQLLAAFNKIESIPKSWRKFLSLTVLNLSCNKLSKLPRDLLELPYLQALYVADNDIQELSVPEGCQVVELVLSGNRNLQSVPPFAGRCSELRTLLMADCGLVTETQITVASLLTWEKSESEAPVITDSDDDEPPPPPAWPTEGEDESSLEVIDLSGNSISEIPVISKLPLLRRLDLSHNKISSIAGKTTGCESLELLELEGNTLDAAVEEVARSSKEVQAQQEDAPSEEEEVTVANVNAPVTGERVSSEFDEEQRLTLGDDYDLITSTLARVSIPNEVESPSPKRISLSTKTRSLPKFKLTESFSIAHEVIEDENPVDADNESSDEHPLVLHIKRHHPLAHVHVGPAVDPDIDSPLVFGLSEMWGRRPTMEDAMSFYAPAAPFLAKNLLISCFDGHAGSSVAKYAGAHVGATFDDLIESITARQPTTSPGELLPSVMRQLLPRVNEHLFYYSVEMAALEPELSNAGATALSVLVSFDRDSMHGRVICANLGDTRCVLNRGASAVRLSVDHKPDMDEDRVRVLGGYVSGEDTRRVNADLAMSRCLGDFGMRPHVFAGTQDVYISCTNLTAEDHFLIIACDGVWDVLSDEEAVDVVRRALDRIPKSANGRNSRNKRCCAAARALRDAAYSCHSDDNISVVVVLLSED